MRDSPDYECGSHRSKKYDHHKSEDSSSDDRRKRRRDRSRDDGRGASAKKPRSESESPHRRDRHDRSHGKKDRTRQRSRSPSPHRRAKGPLPSQDESFQGEVGAPAEQAQKQKPNFRPTGLLAKEANTVAGTTTVLKYHEPAEARKPPPSQQWRMYVFKGQDLLDTVYLFERSCWLIGRDPKVTDLHLEHTSISKQHAVIQFRYSSTINEYGDKINRVKPYLIDLESANSTHMNGKKIEESRYVELVDGDVISFGHSEREYVMMLPAPDKKK